MTLLSKNSRASRFAVNRSTWTRFARCCGCRVEILDEGRAAHAELEPEARRKLERLAKSYERKYPKAAACLRDDRDRLFAYYRFPHETWVHLRTTNAIESIFAPIRTRTDAMKRLRTAEFATAVT
jgi:transposase-like protein